MNDIIKNSNGKIGSFSTYFVIDNGIIFSTNDFNFESKLENCFYIKKLGSNIHPKIYISIKKNNNWIKKNIYIGNYDNLNEFIYNNFDSCFCIRGFSFSIMYQFIRLFNSNNDKIINYLTKSNINISYNSYNKIKKLNNK